MATNAIRQLEIDGQPVIAFATDSSSQDPEGAIAVEVLSADAAVSRRVLSRIDAHVREQSALGGQVVSFVAGQYGSEQGEIRFHPRPQVPPPGCRPAGREPGSHRGISARGGE